VPDRRLDLRLTARERALASSLRAPWRDLLYTPGPGFTSPLEPGAYRSSVVIVPTDGPPVRVSSLVTPAFAGELCRIRLEVLPHAPAASLGSFFEPARRGTVYTLTPDRAAGAAAAPDRAGWRYEGPELASRLGSIRRVRLLREQARGPDLAWQADRGLALAGDGDAECLLLSLAEPPETVLFLPSPGLYRVLLDASVTPPPGVSPRELLGYGDWPGEIEVTVDLIPIHAGVAGLGDPV
jgi:hypothetical protein